MMLHEDHAMKIEILDDAKCTANTIAAEEFIIVFDGVCNFCNGWVSFVSKRDCRKRFKFASAQSATGQFLLCENGFSPESLETILLVSTEKVWIKSDAVFEILSSLDGWWKGFYCFKYIPRTLRDYLYSVFARNRYKLFGKRKTCNLDIRIDPMQFLP